MSNNERSVFEILDEQNVKLDEVSSDLLSIKKVLNNKKPVQNSQVISTYSNNLGILKRFIKTSVKEHVWFGPRVDFEKNKNWLIIVCLLLIMMGVISSIITSAAVGIYGTFTFFENMQTIATFFILSYAIKAKKRMIDSDLALNTCDKFSPDQDGVWRDTFKEKSVFKWLRRVAYVAIVLNIVFIWTSSSGGDAILATIFELFYLGLIIAVFYLRIGLYCMYGMFIIFTGKNTDNTKNIAIVFDVREGKLVPFDQFEKLFVEFID